MRVELDRAVSRKLRAHIGAEALADLRRVLIADEAEGNLGFSAGQFPILIELWNEEGLTQRQLLDRVDVEQATMANTLARMERDGLIERRPHPQDRRAQLIFLTDRARELKNEALQAATEADEALFEGFRRFEKELMLEYIRRAIDNARKLEP